MNTLIQFGPITTTGTELIAVLFGLLSVWFMKKEKILVFPFGIINVLMYAYICYITGLYAYASINIFYFVMSAYGWYNWTRKKEDSLKITRCSLKERLFYSGLIIIFFFILWFLLVRFTDSTVPVWDALTTAIYIVGMWLLARKKIENWILWIAGDTISIFLFGYELLYFSSLQFLLFTIIAVFGFLEWKRKIG